MAVTPTDTHKAFLREVDEELRRERVATIWSRFGVWIVLGIVGLLAAFGGILWWNHHREAVRGVDGEQLQAAYDKLGAGDMSAADRALAPIASSDVAGYRALALMSRADIQIQKNDPKGAARTLATVAADADLAQPLRDVALVRQMTAEFDTLKPELIVSRLRGLAVKGNPWFGSAGELVAVAYLRMNRRDLAATLYNQIASDDNTPAGLRQRAVQMASILGAAQAPQHEDRPAT